MLKRVDLSEAVCDLGIPLAEALLDGNANGDQSAIFSAVITEARQEAAGPSSSCKRDCEASLVLRYVSGMAGEAVRSSRIPAPVPSRCVIKTADRTIGTSVVRFDHDETLVIVDRSLKGIRCGNPVFASGLSAPVDVRPTLLGRVIDAYGEPLDGLQRPPAEESWLLDGDPINPLVKRRLNGVVDAGARAVNGIATIALG